MIFKDCFPGPQLKKIVQVYRLRHFIIPPQLSIPAKPYPTRPEQCIAFYIRGFERTEIPSSKVLSQKPRSVITGQYTELINRFSGSSEFLMLQVVLMPGALYRLTGIPSHELRDLYIDLEDVFPKEGYEVNERLQHFTSYKEIIDITEHFLINLQHKAKLQERPADEIFRLMLEEPAQHSINWLAGEACLSPRQFERKAQDYIGVCPKTFVRVSRFIQSYDMRQQHKQLDWLSIALACGYHDYQHLVKDYKKFANARPNDLFVADEKALEKTLGLKS